MKFIMFLIFIVSFSSLVRAEDEVDDEFSMDATPQITVTKVKGNKAVIQIPNSVKLKVGDALNTGVSNVEAPEQHIEMKRNNRLQLMISSTSTDTKVTLTDGSTGKSNTKSTQIDLTYMWNTEYWEYGFGYGSATSNGATSKSIEGLFYADVEYNFIKNSPKNTIVPYIGLLLGFGTYEESVSGASGYTLKGAETGASIDLGIKFFPWKNGVAIIPRFQSQSRNVSLEDNSLNVTKAEFTIGIFGVGIAGYF